MNINQILKKISELEDVAKDTIQNEIKRKNTETTEQRKNRKQKKTETWDYFKWHNTHVIGVSKKQGRVISEEIMAKNFPNLKNILKSQI